MMTLNVTASQNDFCVASMDFLLHKLFIKALFICFKLISYYIILFHFLSLYIHKTNILNHLLPLIMVTAVLLNLNKISFYLLKKGSGKKFNTMNFHYTLEEKYFMVKKSYDLKPENNIKVYFKELRQVIINPENIIIPLTGYKNIGKFLFIPQKSLTDNNEFVNNFINLLTKNKVKIIYSKKKNNQ